MDLFKQLDIDCCDQIHHGCSYFRRRKQQRSKLKNDDNYGNIYNNIPSKMVSSKQAHCQRQHADHLVSAYSHRDYPIPLIDNKFISLKTYTHFILNHSTIQMTLILILTLFIQTTSSQVNNFAISPNLHNRNSGQYTISQLCASRSQFPPSKRIEGGTLSASHSDTDVNCTVIFRTKSAQQHFVFRFEELKLGCDDHLVIFDGDMDYGQQSISDFSCRDNMASVKVMKTTGTFLTMRYQTDGNAKIGDGFRLVVTAVFDGSMSSECPAEYALCRNHLCISRSLFCDGTNHCLDNSDETGCDDQGSRNDLPYALGLLLALVLIVLICVSVFIAFVHCRRDSPYTQYQHQLQRTLGVPIQTSSSLMFAGQPHYQFFQPANMSPYVTPQHHALATATLPRGYSTLPLNLAQRPQAGQRNPQTTKSGANCNNIDGIGGNNEYLMMTAYPGPQTTAIQATPAMRANFILPTSQSILPGIRYAQPFPQNPR